MQSTQLDFWAFRSGCKRMRLSKGSVTARFAAAAVSADKGIFVAYSTGNDGPSPSQIVNTTPWITTVGVGSVDCTFPVKLWLGNDRVYLGDSLYNEEVNVTQMFPNFHLEYCNKSLLTPSNVMGKIVVCKGAGVDDGFLIQEAEGMGLVGLNWKEIGDGILAQAFTLLVGYKAGLEIESYINTTKNSTANIISQVHTVVGEGRAPLVAAFSSRGPNPIVLEILKLPPLPSSINSLWT
ncbi:hypothetical protein MRB53_023339 [Persea americana]|uniref:Uncharacterized protein n=1 Tax=Persea americana TaxID=3435 RepID=A0ACC2L9B0_PERAE|nr:hypothetical protein MRB53_023339 [Persea americana]